MFSYLDGFVTICSQVSAMEIVNLVNTMFTTLDKLTEKHDVYKVIRDRGACHKNLVLAFLHVNVNDLTDDGIVMK